MRSTGTVSWAWLPFNRAGGPVRITDTGESEPAWAPDAEWIAYYDGTSTLDGGGHERGLMVMTRDGSSVRLVANAKSVTGIDWQPLPQD